MTELTKEEETEFIQLVNDGYMPEIFRFTMNKGTLHKLRFAKRTVDELTDNVIK